MRISDWSSDVCSSDLGSAHVGLLEIRGLKKSFGSLVVLDGIDLDVEEGEIQGVIGPNGAGKSTLFNIINGIYTTGSGTISFRGRSIPNKPVYRLSAMAIGRAPRRERAGQYGVKSGGRG